MRRFGAGLGVVLMLTGCSKATDPAAVSLTGTWRASVGLIGVEFLTVQLVEAGNSLSGTGTWTATEGAGGTLTAAGLHIGTAVSLTITLTQPDGPRPLALTGRVTGADAFQLTFPGEPPRNVTFSR